MTAPFDRGAGGTQINPVTIRGGFQPTNDNAVVDAVAQGLKQVGSVVQEQHREDIQQGIQEQAQSLQLALVQQQSPEFAKSLLAEQALNDEVVSDAFRQATELRVAMKQGVMPRQFAMQRLMVIQQNAIEASPAFADEIRAMVSDATGVVPERAIFQDALRDAGAGELTAEEKGRQAAETELAKQMALTGLDRETLIQIGQQRAISEQQKAVLAAQNARGELLTSGVDQHLALEMNDLTQDFMLNVQQQLKSGGVVNAEEQKLMYNALVDEKINTVISNLPQGADLDAIQSSIDRINKDRDRMLGIIDDGKLLTLMTEQSETLIKGTRLGMMQNSPEVVTAFALNPSDATRGLDLIVKMGESEFGKKLAGQLSSTAKFISDTQEGRMMFMNYYNNHITKGQVGIAQPQTQQERNVHAIAAREAAKSRDPEVSIKALESLLEVHGEDFAWASLGNAAVFSAASPQTHGAAIENLQRTQTAALQTAFEQLQTDPAFKMERISLVGNQIKYDQLASASAFPTQAAAADSAVRDFVEKYNRAAKISKMYSDGGKINSALFGSPAQYWQSVTGEVLQQQESDDATVPNKPIRIIRGDDGKLRRE